jgi:hypothetical protein
MAVGNETGIRPSLRIVRPHGQHGNCTTRAGKVGPLDNVRLQDVAGGRSMLSTAPTAPHHRICMYSIGKSIVGCYLLIKYSIHTKILAVLTFLDTFFVQCIS